MNLVGLTISMVPDMLHMWNQLNFGNGIAIFGYFSPLVLTLSLTGLPLATSSLTLLNINFIKAMFLRMLKGKSLAFTCKSYTFASRRFKRQILKLLLINFCNRSRYIFLDPIHKTLPYSTLDRICALKIKMAVLTSINFLICANEKTYTSNQGGFSLSNESLDLVSVNIY